MKLPPRWGSTTLWSSRCCASTPVSSTATTTLESPRVRVHAAGTFIRLSSHCRIPSGFVTPRNDERLCHGSGKPAPEPSASGALPPPARLSWRSVASSASSKAYVTPGLPSTREMNPSERGTTTRASIALRSDTTTPPAEATAERICAGVVPWSNRTTVRLKGFPAAVAEPENASAAASAARRRLGRFTVISSSAGGIRRFIASSGKRRAARRRPFPKRYRRRSALADRPRLGLGLAVRQADVVGEDVLVVDHAVCRRIWVHVPGIGPDRVGVAPLVDRETAVVAVEARLGAVRRREHRRDDLEVVRRVAGGSAREDVVGVGEPGARTAGGWVSTLVLVAGEEPARRR